MRDAILEVSGLRVSYGEVLAVQCADFSVRRGGISVLLGANGAGKSSILRGICGLAVRQGEVVFNGTAIGKFPPHKVARLGIAYVPDDRGTFLELSVEENLRLGAIVRSNRSEVSEDLEFVLDLFPRLVERRRQQAGTLSGGEQQMLAIGRALMLRPELLLLDEPSFGLAPKVVEEIYDTLRDIRTLRKLSLLLVEQNAEIALEIAEQVYLLETGSVILEGPCEVVRDDPQIRRAYLGV